MRDTQLCGKSRSPIRGSVAECALVKPRRLASEFAVSRRAEKLFVSVSAATRHTSVPRGDPDAYRVCCRKFEVLAKSASGVSQRTHRLLSVLDAC
jgi:hypothetical protein